MRDRGRETERDISSWLNLNIVTVPIEKERGRDEGTDQGEREREWGRVRKGIPTLIIYVKFTRSYKI